MRICFALLLLISVFSGYAIPWKNPGGQDTDIRRRLPEVPLLEVRPYRILEDTLYLKLFREGWTCDEVLRLMDRYMANELKGAKKGADYTLYAKQLKPYWANTVASGDVPFEGDGPELVHTSGYDPGKGIGDAYYPRKFYTTENRLAGKRLPGEFRHNAVFPSGGRIHWIVLHPEDPDKLMVIPDGDAIWRTDNMGKNWTCVTDKIPNRYHRSVSNCYCIPVDPDDWNHFLAFMNNGGMGATNPIYETFDGGETWKQVEGASHKAFKRGYGFKDSKGRMKLIGANPKDNWSSQLWISDDLGKNWREVKFPESEMDTHPVSGAKGFWFQEFAFDPRNRDVVYVPTSQSLFKSVDGGETFTKQTLKIYDQTGKKLVKEGKTIPLPATGPMFMNIHPDKPHQMWLAASVRSDKNSAIYKSENGGKSWRTIHSPADSVGKGNPYGNETPWNWLGGFGVNYADQNYVYGCSMSSAVSTDGGVNFTEYPWYVNIKGFYPDGNLYSVSCARHNADNHCIASHKSGRVFRASDAGLFMRDQKINGHEWVNISGDMGQMLFYHFQVNEFGAASIIGNTQDIDLQTFRRGRWGAWRGYEGSTCYINPYSGEEHFSGGANGRTQLENQDYGSWSAGWALADVCTGNWYLRREGVNPDDTRFSVIKDFGRTPIGLKPGGTNAMSDFALSRDKKFGRVYTLSNGSVYFSDNQGESFDTILRPLGRKDWKTIAVNPDDSREVYIARTGKVYCTGDEGKSWKNISYNLDTLFDPRKILYHEGSGDLYLVAPAHGVMYLENGSDNWKLWMNGYNPAAFTAAYINYTTQEMVLGDYGRGIWIADLEHPCDRYFKDGFELRELSCIGDKRTFGRVSEWVIPMYYNYEWSVNGRVVDHQNSQYLTLGGLKAGDKVVLKQTLMESPDVSSVSAAYTVAPAEAVDMKFERGNYIESNGKGRVDLGYVDLFDRDFSIDLWINPQSDGVVLANRQLATCSAKGWLLFIDNDSLKFRYAPDHIFEPPHDERVDGKIPVQEFTVNAGWIGLNGWKHVTVTQARKGEVVIYVDGVKRASESRMRPEYGLNNALYLSLFADAYELSPLKGGVDELRIWNKALEPGEVKLLPYGGNIHSLVYRNGFDEAAIGSQKEAFSGVGMQVRTRAEVKFRKSGIAINPRALTEAVSERGTLAFTDKCVVKGVRDGVRAVVAEYSGSRVEGLSPAFNKVHPVSYIIAVEDSAAFRDRVTVSFTCERKMQGCRVLVNRTRGDVHHWVDLGVLAYDREEGKGTFAAVLGDINGKEILFVRQKPSVELCWEGSDEEYAVFEVFDEHSTFPVEARYVGGADFKSLKLKASHKSFVFDSVLVFRDGVASARMSVRPERMKKHGVSGRVVLSGGGKVQPKAINAVNRVAGHTNTKAVALDEGGIVVGYGQRLGKSGDFADLAGKNNVTFAGWFRLDDASMLKGLKSLMCFVENGRNYGIWLNNGVLGYEWKELGRKDKKETASGLFADSSRIGQWMFCAAVFTPDSVTLCMNGVFAGFSVKVPECQAIGPLLVGKTNQWDNSFKGAVDEISVWSRALKREEIMAMMYTLPDLKDNNLCFVDFEDRELRKGMDVQFTGKSRVIASEGIPSGLVSFRTTTGDSRSLADTLGIGMNMGDSCVYTIARLSATPSDVAVPAGYKVMKGYYYAVTADLPDDRVAAEIRIKNETLKVGNHVALAVRALGSAGEFKVIKEADVLSKGVCDFVVNPRKLSSVQLLVYVKESSEVQALNPFFMDGKRTSLKISNFAMKPVNYQSALEDSRIVLFDGGTKFRITLPTSEAARVYILNGNRDEVISGYDYKAPGVVDISHLKKGESYHVLIQYGDGEVSRRLYVSY